MTRSSRRHRWFGRHAFALRGAVAAVLLAAAAPSHALGLGAPELASYLGQPFQMRVPVLGDDAADLSPDCVQVLAERGDLSIPGVPGVRTRVARGATRTVIIVTSDRPMNEPAARVVLRVGCGESPFEREFVVLLDPPVFEAPVAASAEAPAALPEPAPPAAATIAAPAEGRARLEVVPRPPSTGRLPLAAQRSAAETRRVAPPSPGPTARSAPAPRRDRLKIVDSDGPARDAADVAPTAAPPAVGPSAGPGAPRGPEAAGPLAGSPGSAAAPVAPPVATLADGSVASPELQAQLTALAAQLADLRLQIDSMGQRNRELSQAADRAAWGWIAASVLGLALLLLFWVYAQTRRRELRLQAMESDLGMAGAHGTAVVPVAPAAFASVLAAREAAPAGSAADAARVAAPPAGGPGKVERRLGQPADLTVGGPIEVTEIGAEPMPDGMPAPAAADHGRAASIPRTLDAYAHEVAERRNDGAPLDIDLSAPAAPATKKAPGPRDPAAGTASAGAGVEFDLDPPTGARR